MAPANLTLEAPRKLMTVDEFWDFMHRSDNADRSFELRRGEVIELSRPTRRHGAVVHNIDRILGNFVFDLGRGFVVAGDAGVILDEDPAIVVGPDVAYFTGVHQQVDEVDAKWGGDLPAIAIEVLSPNDKTSDVNEKVEDYLSNGVKVVWLVDYEQKKLTVYRPEHSHKVLRAEDELVGEPELPGFHCRVEDFFRLPGDKPAAAT